MLEVRDVAGKVFEWITFECGQRLESTNVAFSYRRPAGSGDVEPGLTLVMDIPSQKSVTRIANCTSIQGNLPLRVQYIIASTINSSPRSRHPRGLSEGPYVRGID